MKKIILFLFVIGFSFLTNACDYAENFSYTVDYIAKVNNIPVVTMNCYSDCLACEGYNMTVNNNIIVDSPLTVECQLFSGIYFYIKENRITQYEYEDEYGYIYDQIVTDGYAYVGEFNKYYNCISKLQYRVLPNGDWITAGIYMPQITRYFNFYLWDQGLTLFGKNNIDLSHLEPGTAIMIRLYTENSIASSGDESDLCDAGLTRTYVSRFNKYLNLLPDTEYNLGYDDIFLEYDYDTQEYISQPEYLSPSAAGTWKPHNCITVIYSGNERPIR